MPDSGPRQRVENPRNFFGNSRSVRQAEVAPVPPQAGRFIEVTRRTWRRPFQRNGKSRAVVRLVVPHARPVNLAARPSDQHHGRAISWVPCCRVGRFCRRCRLHIHLAAVVVAVREFKGDEGLVFLKFILALSVNTKDLPSYNAYNPGRSEGDPQ